MWGVDYGYGHVLPNAATMGMAQVGWKRSMITRTTNGDTQSAKFAGHETFCLRYGWPKKAVDATQSDPLVFTRDEAVITLGVGKNMVRSIRHWGLMTGHPGRIP